jgi:hypothetical protein
MPDGHRARIDPVSLDVTDVRWVRDRVDPVTGESILWQKGADWSGLALQDLVEGRTESEIYIDNHTLDLIGESFSSEPLDVDYTKRKVGVELEAYRVI